MSEVFSFKAKLCIHFESIRHAEMVKKCMSVDEELQPMKISKEITFENNKLLV